MSGIDAEIALHEIVAGPGRARLDHEPRALERDLHAAAELDHRPLVFAADVLHRIQAHTPGTAPVTRVGTGLDRAIDVAQAAQGTVLVLIAPGAQAKTHPQIPGPGLQHAAAQRVDVQDDAIPPADVQVRYRRRLVVLGALEVRADAGQGAEAQVPGILCAHPGRVLDRLGGIEQHVALGGECARGGGEQCGDRDRAPQAAGWSCGGTGRERVHFSVF